MPQAIAAIKKACPDLIVWADVCLCGATDHGHCGHVTPAGDVDNDTSVATLAQVALNYARAGADAVAPSDMMDGRVLAIRQLLDRQNFSNTPDRRVRGQVRIRVLRPVSRSRRIRAGLRRPALLSDGSRQCA